MTMRRLGFAVLVLGACAAAIGPALWHFVSARCSMLIYGEPMTTLSVRSAGRFLIVTRVVPCVVMLAGCILVLIGSARMRRARRGERRGTGALT